MKIKKRIFPEIVILFVFVLSFVFISGISGCGNDEKPGDKAAADKPTPISNDQDLPETMTVTVYAYCPCDKCNTSKWQGRVSTGQKMKDILSEGKNIAAADPSVIPLGTRITYDGKEYIISDTGSDIKGNTINILLKNHNEVYNFGVKRDQTITLE